MQSNLDCHEQTEVFLCLYVVNQLHKHLSVGLRLELYAFLHEVMLYLCIVLNDTIMDDGEVLRL